MVAAAHGIELDRIELFPAQHSHLRKVPSKGCGATLE
jgi:hypothetical protein